MSELGRYVVAIIALGVVVVLVTTVADLPPKWASGIKIVCGGIALILAVILVLRFVNM